jgi:hypothetical protein
MLEERFDFLIDRSDSYQIEDTILAEENLLLTNTSLSY